MTKVVFKRNYCVYVWAYIEGVQYNITNNIAG